MRTPTDVNPSIFGTPVLVCSLLQCSLGLVVSTVFVLYIGGHDMMVFYRGPDTILPRAGRGPRALSLTCLLFGILLCVFAILLSIGACISVVLTYFLLSDEDYRWWWRSVLSTGSTSLFIFVYSVFYYQNRSSMSGLVQSTEFFGYSLLTAMVFSLMLGSVSLFV